MIPTDVLSIISEFLEHGAIKAQNSNLNNAITKCEKLDHWKHEYLALITKTEMGHYALIMCAEYNEYNWKHETLRVLKDISNELTLKLYNPITHIKYWRHLPTNDIDHLQISNGLTSIPKELGLIKSIDWLDLSHNNIKKIPAEICDLHKLRGLHVGYNNLSALPTEIGILTNLTNFTFQCNRITTLPKSIGKLRNLSNILGHGNLISEIPKELHALPMALFHKLLKIYDPVEHDLFENKC